MKILLSNYFEELRILKHEFENIKKEYDTNKIIYNNNNNNNTLNNTSIGNSSGSSSNNTDLDPFLFFNENKVKNLLLINRFIIKPTYEDLKTTMENTIFNYIDYFNLIYIIVITIFLTTIVIFYILIWLPFQTNLNTTVKFYLSKIVDL